MTCKIISVVNQKGGAGKTTLSTQLAGAFAVLDKYKILIVDADTQGSATRWVVTAEEDSPFPAAVIGLGAAGKKIHIEVKKHTKDYDIIIIDCPPAIESDAPQSALIISDLAIIPVVPSPPDLWATVGIKKLISYVEPLNENLEKLLVMNMFQKNTTVGQESNEALSEINIPVARSKIGQRTAFRKAAAYGVTVFDLGKEATKAINEITNLSKEIKQILKI